MAEALRIESSSARSGSSQATSAFAYTTGLKEGEEFAGISA
jgi:hypothetical protein